jgi:putative spermidine/putrescine transport system permease protein
MSSPAPQRLNGLALFILPSALLFTLFFFLPIGLMAVMSCLTGNPVVMPHVTFTTRNYARIVNDSYYLEVIWTTLRIGLLTTLFALVIGYPLAHWMARIKSRAGHALLLMAVLAPMLTGIVVRTFAWMTLLSDKGVINQILISAGLIAKPLQLMYNETGIVIGLVHIYVPFMVLTLTGVIGRIDERLEQAAENLGASPLRAFLEVTLPLSLPGILAGSLLVFALAISAYVTPILLGGFQIMTLPILIYQQISANFNIGFAAALGMILLVISLLLVFGYNRVLGLVAGQPELQ